MTHESPRARQYDVYINFAPEDESWVNTMLVPPLHEQGFRLSVGEQRFAIGVDELMNIEQQVRNSYRTIVVLSPAWRQSKWSERIAVLLTKSDPYGYLKRRFWPILLEDCDLPPPLQLRHKADCRNHSNWNDTLNRLIYQLRRLSTTLSKGQTGKLSSDYVDPNAPTQLDPARDEQSAQQRYPEQFAIGQVVEQRYTIISQLGKGGFAITYLADDKKLHRQCVIKQLITNQLLSPEENEQIFHMLEQEAEILTEITPSKQNIPHIYDFIRDSRCFVMNYINGVNLHEILKKNEYQPIDIDEALKCVIGVSEILQFLHTRPQPILHCDIKLDNIILDFTGEIWLIDFGLGRALSHMSSRYQKVRDVYGGTPGYMPPEQIEGKPEPRSDVYALAIVLFMLLTGGKQPLTKQGLLDYLKSTNMKTSERHEQIQTIFVEATQEQPSARPDIRTLLERLKALVQLPVRAPDGVMLKDVQALVDWCQRHWEEEAIAHSAVKWLYGSMAADIEKVWHKSEADTISLIRKTTARFSHVNDHDAGLDAMLKAIEPKGFGRAEAELQVEKAYPLKFGTVGWQDQVMQTLKLYNPGRRYITARLFRPNWITTPTATIGLRPGEQKRVDLIAHGERLPAKRRVIDVVEIHYGAEQLMCIPVRATAQLTQWRRMRPWVFGLCFVLLCAIYIEWYWGYPA